MIWHIDSYKDFAGNIKEYLFLNSHKTSKSKCKNNPDFGSRNII